MVCFLQRMRSLPMNISELNKDPSSEKSWEVTNNSYVMVNINWALSDTFLRVFRVWNYLSLAATQWLGPIMEEKTRDRKVKSFAQVIYLLIEYLA